VEVGPTPIAVGAGRLFQDSHAIASAGFGTGYVSIVRRTGAGFDSARSIAVGQDPVALATGDLNADGYPDVLIAKATGGEVGIWLGGAGGLAPGPRIKVCGYPRSLDLSDLNTDGRLDLSVACGGSGEIRVFLQPR
jgi:VCBS repeat protein